MAMEVSTRCGAFTVMAAVAVWPPSLTVIFADPGDIAVTRPPLLTVAIVAFDDFQVAVEVTLVVERSL